MKPAIVSLAAGRSQLALIDRARELGLAVIAVDRDPQAPGFERADARLVHSTHDAEGLVSALEPLRLEYDLRGVLTKSSGPPVLTAARLAQALGLPGLAPELVEAAGSKPGTLELARAADVATARGVGSRDAGDPRHAGLGFPRVVRPARTRVGKRGIRLVPGPGGFAEAHAAAAANSADGLVLVEEFLEGSDVVVCGCLQRDACHVLALIDEDTRFDVAGEVRGLGFRSPSTFEGTPWEAELRAATARFFVRHRFGCGVFFLTFRVGTGRFGAAGVRLLEAHFDLPGDQLLESFFPARGGPDFLALALALATGERIPAAGLAPVRARGATVLRFVHASALAGGRDAVRARLAALEGCVTVDLALAPTDTTDPRVGLVLLRTAGDAGVLERACDAILRSAGAGVTAA